MTTPVYMPGVFREKLLNGLRCPQCGCQRLKVIWVRHRAEGTKRARVCQSCRRRIVTLERFVCVVNSTAATSKPRCGMPA